MSIHSSIGTPTADSYVTEASANSYFEAREQSDSWTNIDAQTGNLNATQRKENLLKQATREIDRAYRFYGNKYYQGTIADAEYQALEFPRSDNTDVNGSLYIPYDVKYATYEQALWILSRSTPVMTADGVPIKQPQIGTIAYGYIKRYVTRQAKADGAYPWVG